MPSNIDQYLGSDKLQEKFSLEEVDLDQKNIRRLKVELEALYKDINKNLEKEQDVHKKQELIEKRNEIAKILEDFKKSLNQTPNNQSQTQIPKILKNRDPQVAQDILNSAQELENLPHTNNPVAKGAKRVVDKLLSFEK